MAEHLIEILRTRTVIFDERIEKMVSIPKSVPEDERGDWVVSQMEDDKLTFSNEEWEIAFEEESSAYQEANQLDD